MGCQWVVWDVCGGVTGRVCGHVVVGRGRVVSVHVSKSSYKVVVVGVQWNGDGCPSGVYWCVGVVLSRCLPCRHLSLPPRSPVVVVWHVSRSRQCPSYMHRVCVWSVYYGRAT